MTAAGLGRLFAAFMPKLRRVRKAHQAFGGCALRTLRGIVARYTARTTRRIGRAAVAAQSSTQFRHGGVRDDRRRRILAEELAGGLPQRVCRWRRAELMPRKSENYGEAEFLDEQRRLLDLVPRRLPIAGLLWLLAAGLAAGSVAFHLWAADAARAAARPAVLELSCGLERWLSSLTLLLASMLALAVYGVRRYRLDDYHGRYRVWLWAAACWFVLATDFAAGLHHALRETMVLATGTRILGDGSAWWAIPYFFLLGGVGSRLLLDMRQCRCSSAAMVASAGCYAAALAVRFGWLSIDDGQAGVAAKEAAMMGGHVWLLLAMGLHARHVVLDAEGILSKRQPKPAPSAADVADEEEDEADAAPLAVSRVSIDAPHPTPPAPLRPVASTPAARPAAAPVAAVRTLPSSIQAAQSQVNRKLTKQEKRALRERLLAERLKREQQQTSKWSK